jgi:hypothetical protein
MYEAADRGSRVHHACECIIKGGKVVFNPLNYPNFSQTELKLMSEKDNCQVVAITNQDEYHQVMKFVQFLEVVKPIQAISELIIHNKKLEYAGTLDLLLYLEAGKYAINGAKPVELVTGWYLCDLKTSKDIQEDHYIQLSAYWKAYISMFKQAKDKIVGSMILHTNASTKAGIAGFSAKIRTLEELEDDFITFKIIHELWKRKPSVLAPKIFEMPILLSYKTII